MDTNSPQAMAHILIVEDDEGLRFVLGALFERAGFDVSAVATGRAALRALFERQVDLVVLDLGLPDLDGLTVLSRIGEVTSVPVLVLTARSDEESKVTALTLGADDFVAKPFVPGELVARCQALLRRTREHRRPGVIDDGILRLDPASHEVWSLGRPVSVTKTEWRLLLAFASHPGIVLSHADLLASAWPEVDGGTERVKFAVQRLRRRMGWTDEVASPLRTVRGVGYRYRPDTSTTRWLR